MLALIFSPRFVQNIYHSKKPLARHYDKFTELFMYSKLFLPDFMKL
jgi:hypothetical protein